MNTQQKIDVILNIRSTIWCKLSKQVSLLELDKTEDFVGLNLRNLALNNDDLSNFNFTDCDLRDVDLSGCILNNTNFTRANLSRANLDYCKLNYTNFTDAKLIETQWGDNITFSNTIFKTTLDIK